LEHYAALADRPAYPGENLDSLATAVVREGRRLDALWDRARRRAGAELQAEEPQVVRPSA
jgi:hypothetical protein